MRSLTTSNSWPSEADAALAVDRRARATRAGSRASRRAAAARSSEQRRAGRRARSNARLIACPPAAPSRRGVPCRRWSSSPAATEAVVEHVVARDQQRRERHAAGERRGGEQRELQRERDGVDGSLAEQREVRGEQRSRAAAAPRSAAAGARRSSARRAAGSRAATSMPPRRTIGQAWLIMRRLRANSPSIDGTIFSVAARRGRVDRAAAALDEVEREREVVAHDRVDDDVVLAAHRVDRAVAGGHRREPRLERRAATSRSASRGPPGSCRPRHRRSAPGRRRSRRAASAKRARRAPAARRAPRYELASENAISVCADRPRATAASWATTLPPQGSSSTTSAPAARARGGVSSGEPSQATITSSRSRGQSSARALATFAAITSCSRWAAITSETNGSPLGAAAAGAGAGSRRATAADRRQQQRVADLRVDQQRRRAPEQDLRGAHAARLEQALVEAAGARRAIGSHA